MATPHVFLQIRKQEDFVQQIMMSSPVNAI